MNLKMNFYLIAAIRTPLRRLFRAVCIIAGIICSWTPISATAQLTGAAPVVSVAHPIFKQVTEWDEFTGRFIAAQRVEVRARVSGYLQSVHFVEGQLVEAGQLLFTIDKLPFAANAEGAKADVQSAVTGLKRAQLEFERGQRLQSSRAMSKETMEERRATRDSAKAEVAAARAKQRTAELDVGYTEIRSPLAGRSSDIKVDVGNVISGGAANSTILTTIVSLDPIELEFEGSESEMLRYMRTSLAYRKPTSTENANPVQARLIDEEGWPHRGFVSFLDNQLDFDTGTIRARATFPNKDLLFIPGMFARLRMFAQEKHDAVLIPDDIVVSDQARKMVMVVGADNLIEPRIVELGPIVQGLRVVREGLTVEDRVVVNGILRARPGATVTPKSVKILDPSVAP
jgi:RND family efflux transporter MFP subunit